MKATITIQAKLEEIVPMLEVDWITAQMYGKTLQRRQTEISWSKNGEFKNRFELEIEELARLIEDSGIFQKRNLNEDSATGQSDL